MRGIKSAVEAVSGSGYNAHETAVWCNGYNSALNAVEKLMAHKQSTPLLCDHAECEFHRVAVGELNKPCLFEGKIMKIKEVYIYLAKVFFHEIEIVKTSDPYIVPNVKMIRRILENNKETYSFCFKTGDRHSGEYYYDVRISDEDPYFTRTHTTKSGETKKSEGKIELKCLDIVPKPNKQFGFTIDAIWVEDSFEWNLHVDAILLEKVSQEEMEQM